MSDLDGWHKCLNWIRLMAVSQLMVVGRKSHLKLIKGNALVDNGCQIVFKVAYRSVLSDDCWQKYFNWSGLYKKTSLLILTDRHICLLMVRRSWQRKKVGRNCFSVDEGWQKQTLNFQLVAKGYTQALNIIWNNLPVYI